MRPITVATDVYQFGVLCFRVLTGSRPYRADASDSAAWARAVTTAEPTLLPRALDNADASRAWKQPTSLSRLKRQLGGDLDAIVRRMLAKEPRQRYQSMDVLIADLKAYLAGTAGVGATRRRTVLRTPLRRAPAARCRCRSDDRARADRCDDHQHSCCTARRAGGASCRSDKTSSLFRRSILPTASAATTAAIRLSPRCSNARVAQAGVELKNEPRLRADVLTQLSRGLQNRGKLAAALAAAHEAYDIRFARTDSASTAERAASAQQLASVEIENGSLDEAATHMDATLHELSKAPRAERSLIQAYTSLGKLASMRGDAEASLGWYQKVVPLREALPDEHAADLAMDYSNLGNRLLQSQPLRRIRRRVPPRHRTPAQDVRRRPSAHWLHPFRASTRADPARSFRRGA